MVAVGGCCPLVVPATPAVGPAPASREAMSLVRLSISVVHGPAATISIGKASRAHAPNRNVMVFMTFSPGHGSTAARHSNSDIAVPTYETTQRSVDRARLAALSLVRPRCDPD